MDKRSKISFIAAGSVGLILAVMGSAVEIKESTQENTLSLARGVGARPSRSDFDPQVFIETTTTTVATTTTNTHKPRVVRRPVHAQQRVAITGDVWGALARCESGGRNDGGAPYYGYFQFSLSTWRSVGGSGYPNDHDYGTQLAFAKKLQARSGWGQWPVCSRKIGVR